MKIPELMHNVLSNEKDAIEVRRNYHFCYIPRFFLNFPPLMYFEEFFRQKSTVTAGCIKFVTCALRSAPIMENIG